MRRTNHLHDNRGRTANTKPAGLAFGAAIVLAACALPALCFAETKSAELKLQRHTGDGTPPLIVELGKRITATCRLYLDHQDAIVVTPELKNTNDTLLYYSYSVAL